MRVSDSETGDSENGRTNIDQGVLEAESRTTSARTLADILAATAELHPEALALEDAAGGISYRGLLRLVNDQATHLSRSGVRRGDKVGIRIPSGTRDLYVSILATLLVGAAYVPVDADDPEERAQLVFSEAGVVGIIGPRAVFAVRDTLDAAALAARGLPADEDPTLVFPPAVIPHPRR
ncbi:hypothetical protein GY21_02455 [Cryobacterium roopkundense]|uniref:AMP-dependent synthetase/ligase domain-containing protein n=1 Tax=Cryobacterium roopkundense TaxID=1001240 RepID=A0A099JT74_9MICO|nr:hypothetical protein GY21_02455 [Cryobacterium roopkundense]